MRRTKFRRRRQLWMPSYGTGGTFSEGVTNGTAIGQFAYLTNDGSEDGGIDWLASPVTFDTQVDPETVQQDTPIGTQPSPLRDLVSGSEWFLKRVVGKCFVLVTDASGSAVAGTRAPAIEAGAGLIVCNTDEDGIPTTDFNEVNPLTQKTTEDPWVWMRHWLLGTVGSGNFTDFLDTGANALNTNRATASIPSNNMNYGSVMDGPHVDQQTARHIHRDQRLFWVVATRPTYLNALDGWATAAISVYFRHTFRFLGNIRSSSGNRRNAAR